MSKIGQFLYNFTNKICTWLTKQRVLYYVLTCTWGFVMTFIGCIVSLVLLICGKKPKKHKGVWYFNVGKDWGGVELGPCFLTDQSDSIHVKNHETGHTYQNAVYGPFFILIAICSAIRYWYREFIYRMYEKHKDDAASKWYIKYINLPDYDSIWFEGSATYIGEHYIPTIES